MNDDPEKLSMSLEEMELMHLTHTAGDLCRYTPEKIIEDNQDHEFAEIVQKARDYMKLALDAGIAKLSKFNLH